MQWKSYARIYVLVICGHFTLQASNINIIKYSLLKSLKTKIKQTFQGFVTALKYQSNCSNVTLHIFILLIFLITDLITFLWFGRVLQS